VAGSLGLEHSSVQRYLDGKAIEIINSEIVAPQFAGAMGIAALSGRQGNLIRPLADRYQEVVTIHVGLDSQSRSERQSVDPRGRGCAILRDPRVVCVRDCAPLALRVRVMMERLGVKGCRSDTAGDRAFSCQSFTCHARCVQLRLERCTFLPLRPELRASADRRMCQGGVPTGTPRGCAKLAVASPATDCTYAFDGYQLSVLRLPFGE
jgi:hypothetical protein